MSIWTYVVGIALVLGYFAWAWWQTQKPKIARENYIAQHGKSPSRDAVREKLRTAAQVSANKVRERAMLLQTPQPAGRHRPEVLGRDGVRLSTIRTVVRR